MHGDRAELIRFRCYWAATAREGSWFDCRPGLSLHTHLPGSLFFAEGDMRVVGELSVAVSHGRWLLFGQFNIIIYIYIY